MRSNERRLKVRIAIARYLDGDYEGAIDATQRVIRSYPEFPLIYRWLAAALGQGSRAEEAPQALDKAIAIGAGTFDMYVRRRAVAPPEDYEHLRHGKDHCAAGCSPPSR